jgi:hypothetical protein
MSPARRSWRVARVSEAPRATEPGSGIMVLMAKMRMKTGTTWSAGRVGSEMWVDRKTAAERVEITRRERAMERSGRWKSGNWAVKKRAKRMRRVTKRIQTWAETTSCHTNNKTKFTLLINMLVLVSSNIHTILCLFFLLYFEKEGIILQAYRWFMELQWFMIPESE